MIAAIIAVSSVALFFGGWALVMTLRAWELDVQRIEWKTAAEGLVIKAIQEEAAKEAAEETLANLMAQPDIGPTSHSAFADYLAARRKRMLPKGPSSNGSSSGDDVSAGVDGPGVSSGGGTGEQGMQSNGGLLERLLGAARLRMGNEADRTH